MLSIVTSIESNTLLYNSSDNEDSQTNTATKNWFTRAPGLGDAALLSLALLLMTGMAYAIYRRQSAFNGSVA